MIVNRGDEDGLRQGDMIDIWVESSREDNQKPEMEPKRQKNRDEGGATQAEKTKQQIKADAPR